jgi:hypothetical protein
LKTLSSIFYITLPSTMSLYSRNVRHSRIETWQLLDRNGKVFMEAPGGSQERDLLMDWIILIHYCFINKNKEERMGRKEGGREG